MSLKTSAKRQAMKIWDIKNNNYGGELMKITKSQLKQIIKEELESVIHEQQPLQEDAEAWMKHLNSIKYVVDRLPKWIQARPADVEAWMKHLNSIKYVVDRLPQWMRMRCHGMPCGDHADTIISQAEQLKTALTRQKHDTGHVDTIISQAEQLKTALTKQK
jgi:hypothetical protein